MFKLQKKWDQEWSNTVVSRQLCKAIEQLNKKKVYINFIAIVIHAENSVIV